MGLALYSLSGRKPYLCKKQGPWKPSVSIIGDLARRQSTYSRVVSSSRGAPPIIRERGSLFTYRYAGNFRWEPVPNHERYCPRTHGFSIDESVRVTKIMHPNPGGWGEVIGELMSPQ
jgi:hypothetical protein